MTTIAHQDIVGVKCFPISSQSMENRYNNTLREANQMILELTPANTVLRIVLSFLLKEKLAGRADSRIIELGCGEGDLTERMLAVNKDVSVEALDVSKEMLEMAKMRLQSFAPRVAFVHADAGEYLEERGPGVYDFILSAWVIHNFTWDDKRQLFRHIFASLKTGGYMLFLDKVYPDDENLSRRYYESQVKRYRLVEGAAGDDIIQHEAQDFSLDYRMKESETLECLNKVGFRNIEVVDRVEREVVMSARK